MEAERIRPESYIGQYTPLRYNKKAVKGLSIAQMVIGIICFVSQVFMLALLWNVKGVKLIPGPDHIGYGIWSGSLFFVAGLIGLLAALKQPNKYLITLAMVMSIVAASVSSITFTFGVVDADRASLYNPVGIVKFVFGIIYALLAVANAGCSITSSSFGCRALCCAKVQDSTITFLIDKKQPIHVERC